MGANEQPIAVGDRVETFKNGFGHVIAIDEYKRATVKLEGSGEEVEIHTNHYWFAPSPETIRKLCHAARVRQGFPAVHD